MSRRKTGCGGIIGIIVAFVVIFGLIGSCGDNETDNGSSSEGTSSIISSETASSDESEESSSESSSSSEDSSKKTVSSVGTGKANPVALSNVPAYSGAAYVAINNNIPSFSSAELTTKGYEKYAALDSKGRCGVALASCGKETMPKAGEERGDISSIYPTGWKQAQYSGISGGWLYNRCHLIGWQLSAENANRCNLITGTRYMNTSGMLPFENMVADYINETGNHVAYRVTPIFKDNDLVCSGVQMEAYSIEDDGEGICFNVYCYNVQPGVTIDYATGASSGPSSSSSNTTTSSSSVASSSVSPNNTQNQTSQTVYITATGKKYHSTKYCSGLSNAKAIYESTLPAAQSKGLTSCSKCY